MRAGCRAADLQYKPCAEQVSGGGGAKRAGEESAVESWSNSGTGRRESNVVRAKKAQYRGAQSKPTLES